MKVHPPSRASSSCVYSQCVVDTTVGPCAKRHFIHVGPTLDPEFFFFFLSVDVGLNSKVSHLEGESIYGSAKRKLDLFLGNKNDSHHHDCVNSTMPKVRCNMIPRAMLSVQRFD
jgi:hypothetical protein